MSIKRLIQSLLKFKRDYEVNVMINGKVYYIDGIFARFDDNKLFINAVDKTAIKNVDPDKK